MTRLLVLALFTAGIMILGLNPVTGPGPSNDAFAQDKKSGAENKSGETKKKKKKKRRRRWVQVDKVRLEPLVQTMPVIGRLVAVRSGVVAARIDAPVREVKVDVGDRVTIGDILAVLVDDIFKWNLAVKAATVREITARISAANARLSLARQELKRIERLKKSAAFSKARFNDKNLEVTRFRAELAEVRARFEGAQASFNLAETELRYTLIRAPYSGTITKRHTETGAFIKEGQAIFTMVSDRDLEIEADVPAKRIGGLTPGKKVTFELVRGEKINAVVRAVVPEENLRTRTRMVRFTPRFNSRPENLAANQSLTVHLPIGKSRTVLTVHKDSLVITRGVPTVFVVEKRRAYARRIEIGDGISGRFVVLSGLKEGELVVSRGNERLKDGKRVQIRGASN
ncbi:MAG: efflux RND transporter periplasmic adaptor subunit [Alphaproteobacteria bacterium]|nr:efflux RND transporter periplasmic adaptor subunit [Alphaproteobacteria bacterium]